MRVIFAGTPAFAEEALRAIHAAGHEIELVLTRPDKPAGRGMDVQTSAVKKAAVELGLEVFQPASLRDVPVQEALRRANAEVMVVAAYGLILPEAVLELPEFGCINIHASLLPRWRGAAPIQRALLAGDRQTGVCIMQMESGLDTGPVLLSSALNIRSDDTSGTLHDRLAVLGAGLIVDALGRLPLRSLAQDESAANYAAKISKAEAEIDWHAPAVQVERMVRAFNPAPGAVTQLDGSVLKIWQAEVAEGTGVPGTVIRADKSQAVVACGEGALRLLVLQKSGGKRLSAGQFLAGNHLRTGLRLGPDT